MWSKLLFWWPTWRWICSIFHTLEISISGVAEHETRPLIWACMPKRSPNRFSITALSRGWIICKGILSPFHKDYSNPCLLQAVLYVIFQMWQDYPAVNEVYAQFFTKEAAPARAAYQVNLITDLHGFPSFWSTTCTVQGVLHRSLYF